MYLSPGRRRKRTGKPRRGFAERFWEKVAIVLDETSCWLWTGSRNAGGYGVIVRSFDLPDGRAASRPEIASRMAYELRIGPIPADTHVRHACDTPACVRPEHLVLGSAYDNVQDMIARGRMARGEQRGHAKLTDTIVRTLRDAYAADPSLSYERLAQRVGVTRAAAAGAIRGDTWTHVPGPVGFGAKHLLYRRRLTEEQALAIVRTYRGGDITLTALAKQYGVSPPLIHNIITGKAWKALAIDRTPITKPRGRRWSRLTVDQVITIRQRYAAGGTTMLVLAREYSVTEANIHRIVRRLTWSDVAEPHAATAGCPAPSASSAPMNRRAIETSSFAAVL